MVFDLFISSLERHSIVREQTLGTQFDPLKHEAVATIPSPDHAPGTVMEEFKGAYYYKDKLLRPAQVVVAKQLDAEQSEDAGQLPEEEE